MSHLAPTEARHIRAMSVDELEVELVCARTEAKSHAQCGDRATCKTRADAVVDALLEEWQTRAVAP